MSAITWATGLPQVSCGKCLELIHKSREGKTMKKMLMNLQGMTFTEASAREYYGERFDSAELVWVEVDEEGIVV